VLNQHAGIGSVCLGANSCQLLPQSNAVTSRLFNMSRNTLLYAIASIISVYFASTWSVGNRLAASTPQLIEILQASGLVSVYQLSYEPDLMSGSYQYDLTLMANNPNDEDEINIIHLLGLLDEQGIRVRGEIKVSHGPLLKQGLGLAATSFEIPIPNSLSAIRPDYTTYKPLLTIHLRLDFFNRLHYRIEAPSYGGDIDLAGDSYAAMLSQFSLSGMIDNRAPRTINANLTLGQLKLANADLAIDVSNLHASNSLTVLNDMLWPGMSRFEADEISLETLAGTFAVRQLQATSNSIEKAGSLSQQATLGFTLVNNSKTLGSFNARSSLSNLNTEALARLHDWVLTESEVDFDNLVSQLAKAGPSFSLDDFSISLGQGNSLQLTGSIRHPPSNLTGTVAYSEILRRIEAEFTVSADMGFFEAATDTYINSSMPDLTAAEARDLAQEINASWSAYLEDLDVTLQQGRYSKTFSLRDKKLFANNIAIWDLDEFWSALSGLDADLDGMFDDDDFMDADRHDVDANAHFGTHTLIAGFEPDPYLVNITAGGNRQISLEIPWVCWLYWRICA
jgi:hypothetical protein